MLSAVFLRYDRGSVDAVAFLSLLNRTSVLCIR